MRLNTGAGLDLPFARVTLAGVTDEPITGQASPAGGARRGGTPLRGRERG